jgi:hypothetical protein
VSHGAVRHGLWTRAKPLRASSLRAWRGPCKCVRHVTARAATRRRIRFNKSALLPIAPLGNLLAKGKRASQNPDVT